MIYSHQLEVVEIWKKVDKFFFFFFHYLENTLLVSVIKPM